MERKSAENVPIYAKFLAGGCAGIGAVTVTHPLDLVKNRMQMSGERGTVRQYRHSFHAVYQIVTNEGFFAIYKGLTASFFRQSTYTATRLGLFSWMFEHLSQGDQRPPFGIRVLMGGMAGVMAALVSCPSDVVMVRMTLDGRLPKTERRNYANVFNALVRIVREEGVSTLWRGCTPTVLRAVIANCVQLPAYSQVKETLIHTGYFSPSIPTYLTASLCSGAATAVVTMPADLAKTRIQNMKMIAGVAEYKNVLDVWHTVVRYEGFLSLWKGFTPYYTRIAPQTVLMFVLVEEFTRLYTKYVLKWTHDPIVV